MGPISEHKEETEKEVGTVSEKEKDSLHIYTKGGNAGGLPT